MSTNGYENCVSGTFYGFTDSQNNEYHPGDTFNLQWGAIDGGNTPLNISLGRVGGTLIDQIVVGASFSTTSSLYRLVVNETANCTLEQYSWAIPSDFNTTNPRYQIGLFNASAKLGTAGVPLYGWIAWSPSFYVREKSTTTTTTATGTSTALLTGTGEPAPSGAAATSTSTSTSTWSPNSSKIGIGVGVGVGGAAVILLLLLAVYFFRRRRRANANPQEGASAGVLETPSMTVAELPVVEVPGEKKQQRHALYEMQA